MPPLEVPDSKRACSLEELSRYSGVALFLERAAAVKPDFSIIKENAAAVAEICARLDGLPLAIELAAARIKLLPPQALLARLESRLKLLTGGARDLPERQQTLKAAMDWSYELLDDGEKKLLRRLSAFVGGCSLEAAESVADEAGDLAIGVLDGLASLADKSLLRQQEQEGGEARIRMLETIREFGLECLHASGEAPGILRRHADYYLAFAEEAAPKLAGTGQKVWLDRLETEHDNIRAALDWFTRNGEVEAALRLGGALWQFWEVRGYLAEGRARLARVLSLPIDQTHTKALTRALHGAGFLADAQGDYAAARALFEENLAIHRELGDRRAIATSLNNIGVVALRQGDYATARALYEESLAIFREFGAKTAIAWALSNLGHVVLQQGDSAAARTLYEEGLQIAQELGDKRGVAWSINNLGDVARQEHDLAQARSLYAESLVKFRELGEQWGIASALTDLGNVARDQGDYMAARALYEESLAIVRELGHKRGIARLLEGFAGLAAARAQPERAVRLAGAAAGLRETLGMPLPPADQAKLEERLSPARDALSKEAAEAAWTEGRATPLEQAIAFALQLLQDD